MTKTKGNRVDRRVGEWARSVLLSVVVTVAIAGFVALSIAQRPVDSYLYLLGMIAIPTITSILAGQRAAQAQGAAEDAAKQAHGVRRDLKTMSDTVNTVESHVNGNTTRIMNDLESLRAEVSEYRNRYGDLTPNTGPIPILHPPRPDGDEPL